MSSQSPKIVVITPIKNEAWILDRFLAVMSQFADHIIIADQNSTDESVAICKNYPKVTLIANNAKEYNEAERQLLLIQTARDLVPEHKIILALDADEMLAANATQTPGWQTMLEAKPGTVLFIEKVSICGDTNQCIRYYPFPLGYVDDGSEHKPSKIHSVRVPMPEYASKLILHDVKILHYLLMRPEAQSSKVRFYSMVENTLGKGNSFSRRITYNPKKDYTKEGSVETSNSAWFDAWEAIGIDMKSITTSHYYWYDFEVLSYFQKYGYYHFWLEDIWNFDWEACRQYAKSKNISPIPESPISPPPKILGQMMDGLGYLYTRFRKVFKGV